MTNVKGRDLDALIAEKVMGWSLNVDPVRGRTWCSNDGWFQAEAECGTEYGTDDGPCPGECDEECLRWRPSTSPADAHKVVNRLKKLGLSVTVTDPEPVGICEAALRTLETARI